MKYIVSGGGTGGHIYPALAIAKEIQNRDEQAKILYVGTKSGPEYELAKRAGLDFAQVRVKGIPRSISAESFKNAMEVFKGLSDSKKIINEFKPDIAIGTGGYVCGPILFRAYQKNIPILVQEQNAFPGITNKILSRWASAIAIAFDEAKNYLKHPERTFISGNPTREEFFNLDESFGYDLTGFNRTDKIILSLGGSGGQKSINDALLEIYNNFYDDSFKIIHITGNRYYQNVKNEFDNLKDINKENIIIIPYSHDIPQLMAIADLVIASSSAMTLAEISAAKLPSILIPKAYTAENHQEFNAKTYEAANASEMILENELDGKKLFETIKNIITNESKIISMGEASSKFSKPNATKIIVDRIMQLIG
ncbi:MAG: undecaprenyldiphospho-muramoylpentapeptide beta-N-acetylglucosaminyltransferase [Tissierellia bacterium]|nr:undecaprenyldiphospho-muramoylpentapeptide beta-N-acetylglucosaminyltransferase [Tissierellia bacterium]